MILEITEEDHIVNYPELLLEHIREISIYTPNINRAEGFAGVASLRISRVNTITIISNSDKDKYGWISTSEYREILKFFFFHRINTDDIESIAMAYVLGRYSPFTGNINTSVNHGADYYELHIKFKYKKNGENT